MSRPTGLERSSLRVRGEHGELVLRDGRLTITKHGASPSEVTVDVAKLRSVALVAARAGGRGWLHVNVVGGSPTPPGELVAMTDPYAVRITARAAGAAKRFMRLVNEHLRARGLPPEPELAAGSPTGGRYSSAVALTDGRPPSDNGDRHRDDVEGGSARARQLGQLSELHASGALTDEEFERLRARVLR